MKKYISLALTSFIIFSLLLYIYTQTKSEFLIIDKEIYEALTEVKQSETLLDKDLLRIQSFLLQDYDTLVAETSKLETFCRFHEYKKDIFAKTSNNFKLIYIQYCRAIKLKIIAIESFKSQNAIYRNSIFFLHAKSDEWNEKNKSIFSNSQRLASSVLNYALLPDEKSKIGAKNLIERTKMDTKSEETTLIKNHASRILQTRLAISQATQNIIDSPTIALFEKLHTSFIEQYELEQSKSRYYQKLLFILSVILVCLIIYSVLKILRTASALNDANLHLEERIKERTHELMQSQKTILAQQHTVMAVSKMSALGEMAGGVAHEINTPLAVIQMRTDQLLENMTESELDREFMTSSLNAIDQTIKRISKIVLGLRSFSRDGQKDPAVIQNVVSILEDTLSLCREKFNSHGVHIEYKCDPLFKLNCRPGEISQVLLNFLNNSFDAIQSLNQKWIRIDVIEVEKQIKVSITDSGNGIPESIQEKLMQPFFTTKEVGKGTGLGLSISKGIVESHGGQIKLDSANDHTKFDLYFPKTG